jgi:hypothetical protein
LSPRTQPFQVTDCLKQYLPVICTFQKLLLTLHNYNT